MPEFDPSPPLTPLQRDKLCANQAALPRSAYQRYLAIEEPAETSAGYFLWHENMINASERSSYQLAAGSCAVEAALHVDAAYGLKDRVDLVHRAAKHWNKVF